MQDIINDMAHACEQLIQKIEQYQLPPEGHANEERLEFLSNMRQAISDTGYRTKNANDVDGDALRDIRDQLEDKDEEYRSIASPTYTGP